MDSSFLESQNKNPFLIGSLLFAGVALPLSIFLGGIFPGIVFIGDLYFALGMMISVIYVIFTIEEFERQIKVVILIAVFGGIFVAFLMAFTLYLLILATGRDISFLDLFFDYVRIVIFIALPIGIITQLIGYPTKKIINSARK